jgi:hypothetical protein
MISNIVSIFKTLFSVQPYAKRALRVPKTGREIGFRGVAFNDGKVNIMLIFDTNQSLCKTGV